MKNKGSLLIFTGLLLIAAALFLAAYNTIEDYRAERAAQNVLSSLITPPVGTAPEETASESGNEPQETQSPHQAVGTEPTQGTEEPFEEDNPKQEDIPDHILYPQMPMPTQTIEGRDYIGILEIPACDIVLPVISQWSYPNLRVAPCRYYGSAYTADMVIVAHNYKSHFRRLKEVQPGDLVRFTDAKGNVFTYEVALLETLEANAVEEMTSGLWDLTLFTCTVGGERRLTVRCESVP